MAKVRHGQSKHRTVDAGLEEKWFKKKRAKNRKKNKLVKQARRQQR
ncbi:MAG TPA: hypothetical protein VMW50_02560 [Dehalococcoidia bacterium]|nr:hypothetical protein [Dehalococcoidia bacterium]